MKNQCAILFFALTVISSRIWGQNALDASSQSFFTKENIMTSYTVVQKPSIIIVGIECRTSNAPAAGPQDIPQHWGKFYGENISSQIPNKISSEIIALYCDYEGDYTQPYSFVIGCPVHSLDDVPANMVAKIIPAGSYAVFRATGEYPAKLIETWGKIWQQTDLKRLYTADYELYGDRFASELTKEVEVFIAIENKTSLEN